MWASACHRGQATVEAAVILPALMLTIALLVQPICLSYTRSIMRAAAAEGIRAAATSYGGELGPCRRYVFRRLRAVPEVPLFHVGGHSDWDVSIERTASHVAVRVAGHARPLPLMGVLMGALGRCDDTGVVLEVTVSEDVQPTAVGGESGVWQGL